MKNRITIFCFIIGFFTTPAWAIEGATTITADSLIVWGDDYVPDNGYQYWQVDLGVKKAVKIRYILSLYPYSPSSSIYIYSTNDNWDIGHTEYNAFFKYHGGNAVGEVISPVTSGKIIVRIYNGGGNTGGVWKGVKLYFEPVETTDVNEDNYYVAGRLGVGTISPQTSLQVEGAIRGATSQDGMLTISSKAGDVTIGSPRGSSYMQFQTNKSSYIFDKPFLLKSPIISTSFSATDPLTFKTNNTSRLSILQNGNIGIGTETPQYLLDVNGTIRADELYINEVSGADFVFDKQYPLMPLTELKSYIEHYQHLPQIQSAQEMKQDGVSVSELQIQLLQKIEELTLYIIKQEERIQQLEQLLENNN